MSNETNRLESDWNGRNVAATKSPGGVWLLVDYADNFVRPAGSCWPPAAVMQKLCADNRNALAYEKAIPQIIQRLGFYCPLQSLHSEDAITWSCFGPVVDAEENVRVQFLNELCDRLRLTGKNTKAEISLLRRIPHPERLNAGGPELDVALIGDKTVIFGEAKWRSGIGAGQGIHGDQDQIQLRMFWLATLGSRIFVGRQLAVLGIFRDETEQLSIGDTNGVMVRATTWADVGKILPGFTRAEFGRYLAWKTKWSQP